MPQTHGCNSLVCDALGGFIQATDSLLTKTLAEAPRIPPARNPSDDAGSSAIRFTLEGRLCGTERTGRV